MADEYRPPNAAIARPTSTNPSTSTPRHTGTTPDARQARRDNSGIGTALAVGAIFLVVAGLGYAFYNADDATTTPAAIETGSDAPVLPTTTGSGAETNAASPETETSPATVDGATAPAPTGAGTLEATPNAAGTGNATSGGQSGVPAPSAEGGVVTPPVTE